MYQTIAPREEKMNRIHIRFSNPLRNGITLEDMLVALDASQIAAWRCFWVKLIMIAIRRFVKPAKARMIVAAT